MHFDYLQDRLVVLLLVQHPLNNHVEDVRTDVPPVLLRLLLLPLALAYHCTLLSSMRIL